MIREKCSSYRGSRWEVSQLLSSSCFSISIVLIGLDAKTQNAFFRLLWNVQMLEIRGIRRLIEGLVLWLSVLDFGFGWAVSALFPCILSIHFLIFFSWKCSIEVQTKFAFGVGFCLVAIVVQCTMRRLSSSVEPYTKFSRIWYRGIYYCSVLYTAEFGCLGIKYRAIII